MTIAKWDTDGTPADQDCPECDSESSVVLRDSGLWKCEACSTIFDWQRIEEVQTKCGQTFRFPVKASPQSDNLYIESLGGLGRMPNPCRELGDIYWNKLTSVQLLSWIEVITSSLQVVYDEMKEAESCGSKMPPLSSLKLNPYYVLADAIDASEDVGGTFAVLKNDVNHSFWNGLTWSNLHWLGIWLFGRLLDKELIRSAKARVASSNF